MALISKDRENLPVHSESPEQSGGFVEGGVESATEKPSVDSRTEAEKAHETLQAAGLREQLGERQQTPQEILAGGLNPGAEPKDNLDHMLKMIQDGNLVEIQGGDIKSDLAGELTQELTGIEPRG